MKGRLPFWGLRSGVVPWWCVPIRSAPRTRIVPVRTRSQNSHSTPKILKRDHMMPFSSEFEFIWFCGQRKFKGRIRHIYNCEDSRLGITSPTKRPIQIAYQMASLHDESPFCRHQLVISCVTALTDTCTFL
jgi:hypothetical protein